MTQRAPFVTRNRAWIGKKNFFAGLDILIAAWQRVRWESGCLLQNVDGWKGNRQDFIKQRKAERLDIHYTAIMCPSQIWRSKSKMRHAALLASRSAARL